MDLARDAKPGDSPHVASPLPSRETYERAWAAHEATDHPTKLRLHVERRAKAAQNLTFREMVGESAFIPEYELTLIRHIGSGSFATVDICKYHPPGGEERIVAVKRLTSNAALDVEDFSAEAAILMKLKHKNIVQFIGVGSTSEDDIVKHHAKASCYLVQEFMNAGTLKQKVWKQASFAQWVYTHADALRWGKDIAEGLAYLHNANPVVLHRDLKAENILLHDAGGPGGKGRASNRLTAKISDFGLAVSVLEPSLGYRHEDSGTPPSGLGLNRISSRFHEQMQGHVRGHAITEGDIAQASKDMDRRLSLLPSHPSFTQSPPPLSADPESPMLASRRSLTRKSSKLLDRMMSRRSSVVTVPEEHEAYNLTGRAGSYLSMAPEVTMCQPYSEKASMAKEPSKPNFLVDVFSFGVILYEAFLGRTVAHVLSDDENSPEQPEMFAYKVAAGYRLPIPAKWPQDLQQLIRECWSEDPAKRPSMPQVVKQLDALLQDALLAESSHSQKSGCCCVQ